MWLACWTAEEIAEECGCDKATVSRVCCKPEDMPECNKPSAVHTDLDPLPLYNIWKQQEKTAGSAVIRCMA
ncbi:MAG: hypothetical protein WCJ35_23945 [Planctomycetota bacterium]